MIATAHSVPARALASQSRLTSLRPPFKTTLRRRYTAASAQEGSEEGAPTRPSDPDLGSLESTLRRRKKGVKRAQASQPTEEEVSPRRNIDDGPVRAKWREGELLPDGWDRMDIFQKIYELYIGERGLLFWINKLAYASIFVLAFAWVVFRFVGPGLGLYTLKSDFSLPPGL